MWVNVVCMILEYLTMVVSMFAALWLVASVAFRPLRFQPKPLHQGAFGDLGGHKTQEGQKEDREHGQDDIPHSLLAR